MVEITLSEPHPKQLQILQESRRFNVIKCGRKFGKTSICEELIIDAMLDQKPVAYYGPTYKEVSKVWDRIKSILSPTIILKNEQEKNIVIMGGGSLEMWSLENPDSSRGREYARVIIDEAEYVSKLEYAWTNVIIATLAKLEGDAWFLSTPRFGSTYFKQLHRIQDDEWNSWTFTTYDNPIIKSSEIDKIKARLDDAVFRCEYLAEDISLNVNKFIYNFKRDLIIPGLGYIPHLPVVLSFDFNVEPITCLAGQVTNAMDDVRILDEYRLLNSDIEELCLRILTDHSDRMIRVTGDASGQNRTALKRDLNYYKEIKRVLKLEMGQFFVPKFNPPIANTRVLCNSLLSRHNNYHFSDRVSYLVTDIENCEVDNEGGIDKGKDKHQSHLLDCWRYFNNTFLSKWLNIT